jgi:hypothetical protein
MEGVARQSARTKTAEPQTVATEAKASEMTATETHPSATETGTAETHSSAAEVHPSAATKVHAATAKVGPPSAEMTTASTAEVTTAPSAEVSTASAASTAAASGLRGQRHRNGHYRRQQDCANSNSAVFHEFPPGRHVNAARLGAHELQRSNAMVVAHQSSDVTAGIEVRLTKPVLRLLVTDVSTL